MYVFRQATVPFQVLQIFECRTESGSDQAEHSPHPTPLLEMTPSSIPEYGRFEDLAPAAGYFGLVDYADDSFQVNGWMLGPLTIELSRFTLYLNQKLVGLAEPQAASKDCDKVRHRGEPKLFHFQLPKRLEIPNFSRVEVLGWAEDRPLRRLTTLFRRDLNTHVPTPPEKLRYRVTGNKDGRLVKEAGLRCTSNFLDAIGQHRDLISMRSLLDWGCGCGRVTVHLMDLLSSFESLQIQGCDIDGEAIAWCNEYLRRGHFRQVDSLPPLPWPEASFDVVVSCSVFTHLSEQMQQAWLHELRRVITPGGMFLASINSNFPRSRVPPQGISDETLDPMMDGIAPAGYYRGTIQSREYTVSRWANYFDILDFIENGIEGSQDLVVMRKSHET